MIVLREYLLWLKLTSLVTTQRNVRLFRFSAVGMFFQLNVQFRALESLRKSHSLQHLILQPDPTLLNEDDAKGAIDAAKKEKLPFVQYITSKNLVQAIDIATMGRVIQCAVEEDRKAKII